VDYMSGRNCYRRLTRSLQAIGVSALLATGMTWAGSIYDHPIDTSIMAGMAAPECAQVRAMRAGSLLLATQPDGDICRSLFLYRIAFADAANSAPSYTTSIMQDRFGEFRQLIGYVCLLWLAVVGIAIALAYAIRAGYGRCRHIAYWMARIH
jgi:hypothetical protein